MMEGGVAQADASAFRALLSLARKNPFVLRLAFSAGLGGFLFGYDTGVISGALLYIRDDFQAVANSAWLQGAVVSFALIGATIGSVGGGWMSDVFGRKLSIFIADLLLVAGSVIMGAAWNPIALLAGRVVAGLGIGMTSAAAPLYISEVSPAKVRGALVSLNSFLITGAQFLSYLINLGFALAPGTWRWMLGVAAVPASIQLILMHFLPESPRWLFRKGRQEGAKVILRKIYEPSEIEGEIQALEESVEKETKESESSDKISIWKMLKNTAVRRALYAGMGLQIFQQFVGINTVMYYSPTIIQLAGITSNQTALLLSLITSGLNAFGSILSILFIEKIGRKKLALISLVGCVLSLCIIFAPFYVTQTHSPGISPIATSHFNGTCPGFDIAMKTNTPWDCNKCLKASPACGFCADPFDKFSPGACLLSNDNSKKQCRAEKSSWYTEGCPSNLGWLAILGLSLYIISFSPGMGTVPWVVNSEIYPLRYRGVCGGMGATSVWVSNLIVSQTFLVLTKSIGTAWTFMIFGFVAFIGIFFVLIFVPETKGLPIEEVETMLEQRPVRFRFWN
ncbi:probable inositol transporter 2 [Prosopis cineraria]|uniref:probable inositol transporter 2 n=1 Tax=Prosopis cineraria TaxID=364024 RepID=UPI00240F48F1|nr:probable inositol transporter 2 [Prosopis cineraria]